MVRYDAATLPLPKVYAVHVRTPFLLRDQKPLLEVMGISPGDGIEFWNKRVSGWQALSQYERLPWGLGFESVYAYRRQGVTYCEDVARWISIVAANEVSMPRLEQGIAEWVDVERVD